jgi:hypothetical protein
LVSGDESGSEVREAWGAAPPMLLHGVSVPVLRGGILLWPVLKPVCDDVSPGFSFLLFSLCSGVGLGDSGVQRTTEALASMEDPKELIVISFVVRVFFAKLVVQLSTLYVSRRCLLSVYVVRPY